MFHIEYDTMDKHQYFLHHSKQNLNFQQNKKQFFYKQTLYLYDIAIFELAAI